MKILFLDIDGVLNRHQHNEDFNKGCIDQFNRIVKAVPNLAIVISSTWRLMHTQMELIGRLHAEGCFVSESSVIGYTDDLQPARGGWSHSGYTSTRGREVKKWIDENAPDATFVCLEDDEPMDEVIDHVVRCDSYIGLTEELADEAIRMLT